MTVKVEIAEWMVDAVFFVIAGAEPSCLLGLETAQALGLVTLASAITLKGSEEMDLAAAPSDADTTGEAIPKTDGNGVVRLITACKVPRGHGCRVQVQLGKKLDRCDSVIFYTDQERLYRAGVTMEESLLTVEDGQCMQLTVYNRGPSSVTLGEGEVVGKVEACSPVEG